MHLPCSVILMATDLPVSPIGREQWVDNLLINEFKNGRESVEDMERSGHPSTSRVDEKVAKVKELLDSDRRLSLKMIADEVSVNKFTQRRVDVCREMLNELENNLDFLDNVVTGDESWTFQYDPETKAQSSEWHTPASPRPKKARMSKSRVKTMLIVFFDKRGLIHKEFVPQGKTVNAEFYKEVLRRLHKAVKQKRQDLAQRWRLHHDNAPAHTAFFVTSYLTRIGVEVLPQPPYSPDMIPPDFFLVPKVKRCLKGHRFDDIPNIQRAVTKALSGITPTD
ncbi:hypothetical protein LAZ67_4003188 [Cordylochernes scorpioides]|uniref:Transposase n=1 Tax=Cordylochernes scorpioides TaxID=51811 RepID=A0ABY6KI44_9ARAC|nr:hypothetical protein LAZ67_4003188 [Cordylochernes scorpioides]